jgi:hypothetical protein
MSPSQQPHDFHNNKMDTLGITLNAQNPRIMPTSGALDPEALTSIELTAASDPSTQQKRDDPYLVCFDKTFDTEK